MSLPVLTVEQMRAWEKATWAAGVTEAEVIARVGKAVAHKIREMVPSGGRVVLLAGRGNNGNDVRAAVPHLVPDATVIRPPYVLSPRADCPGLPAYEITLLEITDPAEARPRVEQVLAGGPKLVVDGLFGIGLNRALSAEWCRLIETVNAGCLPVLAVDVPSGLDADSGGYFGAVIRADVTLTVGAPKCGLVADCAREFVGRLEVAAGVGLLPEPELAISESNRSSHQDGWGCLPTWTVAGDFAGLPPRRRVESHKGTYGHLVILAGSLGYHGAAVLAAKAAGAARPGLVTVITSPGAYPAIAAQLAFAMVRSWSEPMVLPAKTSAVLIGPGLAGNDVPDWLRAQLLTWWRELPVPLVVDASALDWLAVEHRDWWAGLVVDTPDASARLRGDHTWGHRAGLRVITPHPGEAARWFGEGDLAEVQDRFTAATHLGRVAGIAVLKGHQTLVRGAAEPTFINSTGNPGLAQGGSGDVLAGFLAGLLAQPALQRDPLLTTRYAVWEHGAAADRLEAVRRNWTAEDLAAEIGR